MELTLFHQMGLAIGLGLLVGLQRERAQSRLAGIRMMGRAFGRAAPRERHGVRGASRKRGMTFIELVVVIVITSILAVIVIPRYTGARERAYVAVMQADLSQLRISQEMHRRSAAQVYADDLSDLTSFRPSPDVTITLLDRGELEWGAEASHANTSRVCRYESMDGTTECEP